MNTLEEGAVGALMEVEPAEEALAVVLVEEVWAVVSAEEALAVVSAEEALAQARWVAETIYLLNRLLVATASAESITTILGAIRVTGAETGTTAEVLLEVGAGAIVMDYI